MHLFIGYSGVGY